MNDATASILTAFTICAATLNKAQIREYVTTKTGIGEQELDASLETLVLQGELSHDAPYYRITFSGILAAAQAKREQIRRRRDQTHSFSFLR